MYSAQFLYLRFSRIRPKLYLTRIRFKLRYRFVNVFSICKFLYKFMLKLPVSLQVNIVLIRL